MFTVREVSGRWRERERGGGNIERERRKTIVAVASSCLAIGTNLVEREGGREDARGKDATFMMPHTEKQLEGLIRILLNEGEALVRDATLHHSSDEVRFI